jgi:hypothetical protein
MPSILPKPGDEPREIVGVGIVTDAGIPLERAAESMRELRNDDGPLAAADLTAAATAWAETAGFTVGEPAASVDEVRAKAEATVDAAAAAAETLAAQAAAAQEQAAQEAAQLAAAQQAGQPDPTAPPAQE